MNVSTAIEGKKAFITVTETATDKDFDSIYPVVSAADISEICVDLKAVYYIKSLQIAELLTLKKWADDKFIPTTLLNVATGVYQVLEMLGLSQIFEIRQDYSRYTVDQLIDMFNQTECADEVSSYLVSHYSDKVKSILSQNIKSTAAGPVVQEHSLLTIGRAHDGDSLDSIRNCLQSDYPNVVHAAILVLGWLGDVGSKEEMYKLMQSPFIEIAEAAGASLALLSDEEDVSRIGTLGKSDNPKLRMIVAGTLSLINGDEAFKILKGMLSSESDPDARRCLVKRVSFFNKPEATEILVTLLDDKSKSIQEVAAAGLERTGLRGHNEAVFNKVSSDNNWVSYFAVKALGRQGSNEFGEHLIQAYPQTAENVKLAIIEALGYTGAAHVEAFLTQRLADSNEDIRKEALTSLSKIAPASAAQKAINHVKKDTSWLVRYKALEILESVRPEGFGTIINEVMQADNNRYVQEKASSILDMINA